MKQNFNGPDLKQARIRTKNDTQILKDQFEIPSHMENIGEGKSEKIFDFSQNRRYCGV